MHLLWVIILIFPVIIYFIFIILFYRAWNKTQEFEYRAESPDLQISVIIPARNEALQIGKLLSDLKIQQFNPRDYEIIIVNDHSEDNTLEIVEKYKPHLSNLKIINLPNDGYGKKKAILKAVENSKGELFVTIDADCRISSEWLSTISSFYNIYKPRLIIGALIYHEEKDIFDCMQSLEILGLIASGAGAAILGYPILCNGANLAFTRETYNLLYPSVHLDVASGDDIFLLSEVKKRWPGQIQFLKSSKATVRTKPEINFHQFIEQRKRWTSKAKFYNDFDIIFVASLVFFSNLSILISLFLIFFKIKFFFIFVVLFGLKSIPDLLLLNSIATFFEKRRILRYFWITQLVYPIYIVFMAVYGNSGKIKWKNRIINQ